MTLLVLVVRGLGHPSVDEYSKHWKCLPFRESRTHKREVKSKI